MSVHSVPGGVVAFALLAVFSGDTTSGERLKRMSLPQYPLVAHRLSLEANLSAEVVFVSGKVTEVKMTCRVLGSDTESSPAPEQLFLDEVRKAVESWELEQDANVTRTVFFYFRLPVLTPEQRVVYDVVLVRNEEFPQVVKISMAPSIHGN